MVVKHNLLTKMSEQDQVIPAIIEDTVLEPEIVLDETPVEETVESLKAQLEEKNLQLAREVEARRQLTARAKGAEAKAKVIVPVVPHVTNEIDNELIERTVLKSQGMSDEILGELVALSKVRGKSLLDTQSDPIFIALKESREAEAKSAKAKLGASKGSGSVKVQKNFNTPDLSEAEHKEMWRN